MSKAFNGVCVLFVYVSVCVYLHDKTKAVENTITKLASCHKNSDDPLLPDKFHLDRLLHCSTVLVSF